MATTQTKDKMEGALLLDVVIRKSAAVLKLLACKDQALLVRWDSFLVLDLRLNIVDGVARLNLQGNGLTRQGLDEDLHPSAQSEHQVERGLLLNVVIGHRATRIELVACVGESLLVRGHSRQA